MPLMPVRGRGRQMDLCEFKARLVYRVSSRTVKATQRNTVLKTNNNNKREKAKTNKQKIKKDLHVGILLHLCLSIWGAMCPCLDQMPCTYAHIHRMVFSSYTCVSCMKRCIVVWVSCMKRWYLCTVALCIHSMKSWCLYVVAVY